MLASHSMLQLVLPRVRGALMRLQQQIWQDFTNLSPEATKILPEQISLAQAKGLPRAELAFQRAWGRLFDQRWVHITLPAASDENTWLNWRDQAEATLYIDDKPYFGFNVAHRFCPLPAGTKELWLQSSCVQSGIAHPEARMMGDQGSFFEGAFLCRRDDLAWEVFHDLQCLWDVFLYRRHEDNKDLPLQPSGFGLQPPLWSIDPVYRRMLRLLDEAINCWDTQGLASMHAALKQAYEELRTQDTAIDCILTGHAHLDLVWLWPRRIGEIKAVNIFATANQLMDRYPEFKFAYSQPASYEAVSRREPALGEAVAKRMASGQWEATGAMYVEADTTFACGEALGRSFIFGQKSFMQMNHRLSRLLWLPDVFGYSACLPQLMQLNGVDSFFTTKLTWNAINRFPYSSFVWRGNDGSQVLAHVSQDSSYVTHMEVADIKNPERAHQQSDVHFEFLLPTGYGDGGGGPTDAMCERARRLGGLPGMPHVKWDQPEAFFERMHKLREKLPVYQGECYLEYHRGTFTTHGNLKQSFRQIERALFCAEAASVVSKKAIDLSAVWKAALFSQFHDFIPGSSVWDVYLEELPALDTQADTALAHAHKALESQGEACLFNPHAMPMRGWVSHKGERVFVELPALAGTPLNTAIAQKPAPVHVDGFTVSNTLASFSLNEAGLIHVWQSQGRTIALRAPVGECVLYPDKAGCFEAWDIDRHVLALGEPCQKTPVIEAFCEDEIRGGFRVSRPIGKHSHITLTFALEAGSPLLHVQANIDWQEPEHLLKFLIPTAYAATHARFGIPFGSVLRPQIPSGLAAEAMWEVPFNRYLCVFDEGEHEGLMLVSKDKYGACVRDGVIGLSLVRSPRVPGFEQSAIAWPPHLTRLKVQPYSDLGRHQIQFALGSYDRDLPREQQPAALAETLFTSPLPYEGSAWPSPLGAITGGATLIPAWSMPLENGAWLLRLHEVSGARGACQIQASAHWQASEATYNGAALHPSTQQIGLAFAPYKILTIRFDPVV